MNHQHESQGDLINMAAFLGKSQANGPGLRAVIWVQGCPRRCPGCFNQDMLEFRDNRLLTIAELMNLISCKEIEGVTFSGGEPFCQAAALAVLARRLRAQGLNIIIFTGYTYSELAAATNPAWNSLLASADLLIAGPYRKNMPSYSYLLGSANQELIFLSDRFKNHPDMSVRQERTMEITVDTAGNVTVTGLSDGFTLEK